MRTGVVLRGTAALAVAAISLLVLAGCDDDDASAESGPDTAAESTAAPQETEGTDDDATTPPSENLPEGFPDIGVPFYSPAELVASPDHGGDPYVLEFVTNDELSIVNMFIRDQLTQEHGWKNVKRTVTDQTTVTEGVKDGYELVIAVLPERTDDSKTSIHYTMRAQ